MLWVLVEGRIRREGSAICLSQIKIEDLFLKGISNHLFLFLFSQIQIRMVVCDREGVWKFFSKRD